MTEKETTYRRDLFEIENARNLTRDELVTTFVPTKTFWSLLSAKNQIILGSRGSGKTALAKMLSHNHLSHLNSEQAQQVVKSRAFIGIYVPTRVEWVGGLKNKPWQTDAQKEEFFQWRLNISTCLALLVTLKSCVDSYLSSKVERAILEEGLAIELSKAWSEEKFSCKSFNALHNYLEDVEHRKQQQLARKRIEGTLRPNEEQVGISFETELFSPLRRGITLAARALKLPNNSLWMLCLDEAEFLEEMHHRILNTHLRSFSGDLIFKITTMPYKHYTLETNTNVSLQVGQDFEYIYIDKDPILKKAKNVDKVDFAKEIFNKRAGVSAAKYHNIKLSDLLGMSSLLEPKNSLWKSDSHEMQLLKTFADAKTYGRALKLIDRPKDFADQISRKIHSALLLRKAIDSQKGRAELDCYSGDLMAVRCSDGNPRRLIRIFKSFLDEAEWKRSPLGRKTITKLIKLSSKEQTRTLTAFSTSVLTRVQSEPGIGPSMYALLESIGNYMKHDLLDNFLTTDQVSSVRIDMTVSDEHWKIVEGAVGLGLLYPNINVNNPDCMPYREGTFHIAYVLAPHFRIIPRRGKSVKLSTILKQGVLLKDPTEVSKGQLQLKLKAEG